MTPEPKDRWKVLRLVVITVCELPILVALARTIAPETSLVTTALLMAVAVVLNWGVLHHFGFFW